MTRILSRDGNVISADFRPSSGQAFTVTITTEILYRDDAVVLIRTTAEVEGKPIMLLHFAGDLRTGKITQI